MPERGIFHSRFEQRIIDAVEFEREEQQMRRSSRQPLLHVAVEFGDGRVDRIAGMHEAGVRAEPAHEIIERLIAAHDFGKRGAGRVRPRQIGELALIGILERDAFGVGLIEIALDGRIVDAGVKIAEVPLGQRSRSDLGKSALGLCRRGAGFRGPLNGCSF